MIVINCYYGMLVCAAKIIYKGAYQALSAAYFKGWENVQDMWLVFIYHVFL